MTIVKIVKTALWRHTQISNSEQRELTVIENNLILDPVEKQWFTQYPYKCDPPILENNEAQVRNLLMKTEKRYKEEFQDSVMSGF